MKSQILTPVLLPTDDASELALSRDGAELNYWGRPYMGDGYPQHLHLCSDLPIKEGDWSIYLGEGHQAKYGTLRKVQGSAFTSQYWNKIEFSTDPLLIKDGVPALDGNTSATKSELDVIFRINFLEEFCLRHNQKDNERGVDVDELAESLALERRNVQAYTEEYCEGVKDGFEEGFKASQALQSASGVFSLPSEEEFDEWIDENVIQLSDGRIKISKRANITDWLKSLNPSSGPSGSVLIECDMEEDKIYGDGLPTSITESRVRLVDGKPVLRFL